MRKAKSDEPGGSLEPRGRLQLIPPGAMTAGELAREIDVDLSTVIRWIKRGCKGPAVNGVRPTVLLRAMKRGGRYVVAPDDFAAFSGALMGQQAEAAVEQPPGARTPAQRRKAIADANELAESLGA